MKGVPVQIGNRITLTGFHFSVEHYVIYPTENTILVEAALFNQVVVSSSKTSPHPFPKDNQRNIQKADGEADTTYNNKHVGEAHCFDPWPQSRRHPNAECIAHKCNANESFCGELQIVSISEIL